MDQAGLGATAGKNSAFGVCCGDVWAEGLYTRIPESLLHLLCTLLSLLCASCRLHLKMMEVLYTAGGGC